MYTHSLKSLAWHLVLICLPRDTVCSFRCYRYHLFLKMCSQMQVDVQVVREGPSKSDRSLGPCRV